MTTTTKMKNYATAFSNGGLTGDVYSDRFSAQNACSKFNAFMKREEKNSNKPWPSNPTSKKIVVSVHPETHPATQ